MHQHQAHGIRRAPIGNMSRPPKPDPPSSHVEDASRAAAEEAALLALLRRLGLAFSPTQSTPNGPQGLSNGGGANSNEKTTINAPSNGSSFNGPASIAGSSKVSTTQHKNGRLNVNASGNGCLTGNGGVCVSEKQSAGAQHGQQQNPKQRQRHHVAQLTVSATDVGPSEFKFGNRIVNNHQNHPQVGPATQACTSPGRQSMKLKEEVEAIEKGSAPQAPGTPGAGSGADGMVDLMRREITAKEAVLLGPLLWSATGVKCLKLCYNHLKDGGAQAVSLAMQRHPSLHTMDLGFNGIADQGAVCLARSLGSNRSLHTLYLSGNSIGPAGAKALAESLSSNGHLETLHLTGNCIGPDGATSLADALRKNKSLTRLYLGGAGIKARGACAMASALLTNRVLRDLHMSDNEIGDNGLEGLAHALRRNSTVKLLELCFNRITAAGAESFSKAIWGCKTLRSLRLDNNQLGDRGAHALASALPSLALQTLELGFNNIGALGVAALMQAAVNSPAFESLSLSGNALDAEAAKAIQAALAQPRCALRRLCLDHTSLGRTSESFIATGVLSNRRLTLCTLTGFRLGVTFARLGMPQQVEEFSNDKALEQVRLYWANHDHQASGNGGNRATETVTASSATRAPPSPSHSTTAGTSGGACVGGGRGVPGFTDARAASSANEGVMRGNGVIAQHEQFQQQVQHVQPGVHLQVAADAAVPMTRFGGACGQPLIQAGCEQRQQGRHAPARIPTGDGQGPPEGGAPSSRAIWGEGSIAADGISTMKSCRVAAGPNVVYTGDQSGGDVLGLGRGNAATDDVDAGGLGSMSCETTRQPLVRALHQIAQMPFNGAELWSLHQYYFSPAPEPPVTPIDGTESVPSPSDARSSTAAAASTAQAGAAVSGKDRHAGYVCTGWADAVVAMSPRKVNVRGCDGANRDGFGQSDGSTSVTEEMTTPGAGDRRSRRSSSIGGEDDDEDPDSPLPPSKRYRNASTKTRIACFPMVQDRIRVLKTKPDERGVLTILRQLKFLQGGCETVSLSPEAGTTFADPMCASSSVDVCDTSPLCGEAMLLAAPGRSEAQTMTGVMGHVGPKNILTDQEIETLLLEEL